MAWLREGAWVLEAEGEAYWRHQSPEAAGPYPAMPYHSRLVFDGSSERAVLEVEDAYAGGFREHILHARSGTGGFDADLLHGTVEAVGPGRLDDLRPALERAPHRVLEGVLEQPEALRWAGQQEFEDHRQSVVSGLLGSRRVTLWIDAQSALLSKVEQVTEDPFEGDVLEERIYSDYAAVDSVSLPQRWRERIAGSLELDLRLRLAAVQASATDSLFVRPAGLRPSAHDWPERLTQAAPGVWFYEGAAPSCNILFVELGGNVLVVDAPPGAATAERVLARVAQALPGRHVRWVAVTHHHDDHAGGLRPWVASGVTVLTTPGNVALFEGMARASFTLERDRLAREPRPIRIETVEQRRTLQGGGRTVELIDIGPAPHAQEMLVAWLPDSGILFQADQMNATSDGGLQAANESTQFFATWLKASGLPVRTILGAHSPGRTPADLDRALAMAPAR